MTAFFRYGLGFAMLASITPPLTPFAFATAVTAGNHYFEGSRRKSSEVPAAHTCANQSVCHVIFNVIPAGKQLVVTDASCQVFLTGPGASKPSLAALITYAANGATDRMSFFTSALANVNDPMLVRHVVSGKLRHVFKAGERPVVRFATFATNTSWTVDCSISGTVGNPPD